MSKAVSIIIGIAIAVANFAWRRLKEPSTWRGLVAILTAAGMQLSPEQQTAIVSLGLAAMGLLGTITPEGKQ